MMSALPAGERRQHFVSHDLCCRCVVHSVRSVPCASTAAHHDVACCAVALVELVELAGGLRWCIRGQDTRIGAGCRCQGGIP